MMRKRLKVLMIFCVTLLLVALGIQISASSQSAQSLENIHVPIPSVSDLQLKYGTERNLSSADVRNLYNKLITDVGEKWERDVFEYNRDAMEQDLPSDHVEDEIQSQHIIIPKKIERIIPVDALARGCNLLRHRIKIYCRARDSETSPIFLAVRDFWVHGISALFDAHRADVSMRELSSEVTSCIAENEDRPCPSYDMLRHAKGCSDDAIIASAKKSNKWYNDFARREEFAS